MAYLAGMHLLNLWTLLKEWDKQVFILLNNKWTNPLFDAVLPWVRNPSLWIPLYLFLLFFVLLNFKKNSGWWILLFIATVALTDLIGTNVFKHNFERMRPCEDPAMTGYVRLLLKSCGGYSFISNHAANHFGMATFFYISFRKSLGKWVWIGFAWAALIVYAQVYVGLHYPADVITGALVGILIGSLTGYLFNKQFGFAIFDKQPIANT